MPTLVNELLQVDRNAFELTGAYNGVLEIDSNLFIDPKLLVKSSTPELKDSHAKLMLRFDEIMLLLEQSKTEGDPFWRGAEKNFNFPEVEGLCIGYARSDTSGSGIGNALRTQVLKTAKIVIDAGIKEPRFFELIGVFEEGIGADRISDMTASVIIQDLRNYTRQICKNLGASPERISIDGLPINPHNNKELILVPKKILADLPMALSCDDIDRVCSFNNELREQFNAQIGDRWKNVRRIPKSVRKQVLLNNPKALKDWIEQYKTSFAKGYDFNSDPLGEIIWLPVSRSVSKDFPLPLSLSASPSKEDILKVVLDICKQYKHLIEDNGLWSLLYDANGNAKNEKACQKLFYGVADSYCKFNNLDLSPEVDSGRGPVDFKMSSGYKARVLVEVKLASNTRLLHGFEVQIKEYQKAESTDYSLLLIVDLGHAGEKLNNLRQLELEASHRGERVPKVFIVDGLPKDSASRYTPRKSQ